MNSLCGRVDDWSVLSLGCPGESSALFYFKVVAKFGIRLGMTFA